MHWYEGSIAEAVALTRKNGAIFVVYIEGTDEESTNLTRTIDQDNVSKLLGTSHFVAIKIEANSVPHQQFSEIYTGAKVPSVYFIGKNGAPLDIIEKTGNSSELQQKVEGVLKKAGITINQTASAQSSDLIGQEQQNAAVYENGTLPQSQQAKAGSSKFAENAESENGETTLTTEEKVEKAKEMIEIKRKAKQKEEEEKEKVKEMERRKVGQDVQKMKRLQQDQELKQLIETREKDKREQMEAKQRILDQIKQDKADRAARFAINPQPTQSAPQPLTPPAAPRVFDNGMTRIQFKLPDGSTNTTEFTSDTTLRDVRLYIKTNLNLSFNFMLATTFPKREFTIEHDANTLAELELIPSAVLLILPVSHGTVSTNSRTFTSFLWSVLAPILNALSYLKSLVFGAPKPAQQEPTTPSDNTNKRPADTMGEASRQYAKKRAGETSVVKRQGNIHRLSDKTDSDDENNTWNGNSTQQM